VEERSSSVPVVVPVSADVEEILASEPPDAMTDVVCGMIRAVPVVNELAVYVKPLVVVFVEIIVEVFVPTLRERLPDGDARASQEVEALPAQELQVGAPPFAETRHSVPVPPVAVAATSPELSEIYMTPLV